MQIQNLENNKSNLIAVGLLVLTLVGVLFFIVPKRAQVAEATQLRDQKLTQNQNLTKELANLQALQNDLNVSSEVERKTILASIPTDLSQDQLVTDLYTMAKSHGMIFNGVNFNVAKNTSAEVNRVGVSLSVQGDQKQLVEFLKALENNTRKFVVKSITVQVGKVQDQARVNFNLSLEAYYQNKQ